jgi:hypothetical protein
MDSLARQLNSTKDQAMAQIAQSNFLKVPATVQDTANAAVLIASDRADVHWDRSKRNGWSGAGLTGVY